MGIASSCWVGVRLSIVGYGYGHVWCCIGLVQSSRVKLCEVEQGNGRVWFS